MTSGDDITQRDSAFVATSRREQRAAVASAAPRAVKTRKPRAKKGLKAVFASLAAAAFAAGTIVPAAALAGSRDSSAPTTMYAEAVDGAQDYVVASEADEAVEVDRDSYASALKPKPKPKPKVVEKPTAGAKSSGSVASVAPRYSGGGSPAQWMAAAGIAESDWGYVNYIVRRESGWNPNATNRSSGACGLVQVYPCSKLANARNPVVNLKWADRYAKGRYGSWAKAYAFWASRHWW